MKLIFEIPSDLPPWITTFKNIEPPNMLLPLLESPTAVPTTSRGPCPVLNLDTRVRAERRESRSRRSRAPPRETETDAERHLRIYKRSRMGRLAFVAWVLATAACLAPASAAEYIAPPYLTRLFPDKGHVVGGTSVTIFGGGFVRDAHASVRFAHASGEVDVVPAHAIDSSRISCITPERTTSGPHVAHVSVSNDGATYTSFPLVEDPDEDDGGTYLHFTFADGKFSLIFARAIRMNDVVFF